MIRVKEVDVTSARFGGPIHVRVARTVNTQPSWTSRVRALLHRPNPLEGVDTETWCLVEATRNWESELTTLTQACEVRVGVFDRVPNEHGHRRERGILVRHADLAEQMVKVRQWSSQPAGRYPGEVPTAGPVCALINRPGSHWVDELQGADAAGVAIAGSYPVATATIHRCLSHHLDPDWDAGRDGAVATGTDPVIADRRRDLYRALGVCGRGSADLELWDRHATAYGVNAVTLAIRAGFIATEITPQILADTPTLTIMATLHQSTEKGPTT